MSERRKREGKNLPYCTRYESWRKWRINKAQVLVAVCVRVRIGMRIACTRSYAGIVFYKYDRNMHV